jgi:MFS family permease
VKIPYRYAVALTAALGLFMAVLDNTIVNVALTAMQISFHTDINTIQWVITAYFLAQAAVIPVAGYLALRVGLKRTFIVALAIFTLGSLLCGLSPHLVGANGGDKVLIIFRVFQGIGGGMLFPLATAIAFGVFPPAERASSSAVIALPVLLAPTLGPTVGGLIVDSSAGWPGIFFINIPVGIIAILLFARIYQPQRASSSKTGAAVSLGEAVSGQLQLPAGSAAGAAGGNAPRPKFDYVGLILSIVGVVLVVYAFTVVSQTKPGSVTPLNPRGAVYGFGYWLVWTLLGAGLALLAVFAVYETRVVEDPVLDLRLYRSLPFTLSNVLTWVVRAVIFGSFFLIPLFLQQFRGMSAVESGLALLPQGLAAAVGIVTASRLYDRLGPRVVVVVGLILLTISSWMLSTIAISTTTTAWDLTPTLVLRGIGFGWSNLPLQTLALSAITGRALPKASSLFNATAQIFSSIGIALISTTFIQQTTTHGQNIARAAVSHGQPMPRDLALQAATSATKDVFLYAAIATAVSIAIALFLPARSIKGELEAEARAAQTEPRGQPSLAAE